MARGVVVLKYNGFRFSYNNECQENGSRKRRNNDISSMNMNQYRLLQ